jgi:2-polyprenyl-3-methyl-5-hydroxy-6-metoxy-1,4-benzoquinol methylase
MPAVTLDLNRLSSLGQAEISRNNGGFSLKTPPLAGAYGAQSPRLRDWNKQEGSRFPAVLRLDLEAEVDSIGVALFTPDGARMVSGEQRLTRADGRQTIEIYVEEPAGDACLIIRNYGTTGVEPRARIYAASVEAADELPPAELKRLRAKEFSFWYYSMDLGDGVSVQAGLPDAPLPMEGHVKGRSILHWLLDRYFGGVKGKTVWEPGCSGGFHSLELARRGAIVTGCDPDQMGISQARFAADCLKQQLAHQPRFFNTGIYEFQSDESPFDLVYCSGLLYHLSDIPRAVKIIADSCKEGAVIQTSISDLEGDILEFANADKYPFSVPRGEFAFVPTRSVLPKIFRWAGFDEVHMFDLTEFHGSGAPDLDYQPGFEKGSLGPIYAAVRKTQK